MSVAVSHPAAIAAPVDSQATPISGSSRSSESVDEKPIKNVGRETAKQRHVDRSASTKRWKTFVRSFKHIYSLTPKEVEDFMRSYRIYENDWADEEKMISAFGPDYQQQVGDSLKAYYSVLNHLCSLGDVEKMYIPPVMDKKASVLDNQLLNEEAIAEEIGLAPSMKVLDLGCGRGRVAAHMSSYSGAQVTGLNIDENQINQARQWNTSLGNMNKFVVHDQNNLPLPFEDQSFDAFYEIQALSLCKDPSLLFKEIHRILKPGAKFLLLDWVSLPAYDPENPTHASLMRRVKPLIGAVGTPTPASFEKALVEAGFTIIKSDNPSIDGRQAALIDKVDFYFRSLRRMIHGLVHAHLLPPHFTMLIDRFCLDGKAFEQMDDMGLVTTTYRIVAQKI
ncbi:unnamed protein product [Clonostachys chloroleuca]|uniref:Methyltransferase type 11 domain-containing protein n=1 Tax=Clonostachys chloroleuca TaxID=1926264 RepID=A0AA35M4C4_9HYPO|nr:unnamed protein product [Clonostachys chloroleuca]